jgi:hypothetical protein
MNSAKVAFTINTLMQSEIKDINNLLVLMVHIMGAVKEASKVIKLSTKERVQMVDAVIDELGKGNDGILGTKDDMISEEMYKQLKVMHNQSIMSDFMAIVQEFQQHKTVDLKRLLLCCTKLN